MSQINVEKSIFGYFDTDVLFSKEFGTFLLKILTERTLNEIEDFIYSAPRAGAPQLDASII